MSHPTSALDRSNAVHRAIQDAAWREIQAYLEAASSACEELVNASKNGDAQLARAVRKAVDVETTKIRARLGEKREPVAVEPVEEGVAPEEEEFAVAAGTQAEGP